MNQEAKNILSVDSVDDINIEELFDNEEALSELHPQLANVIRIIQAEKLGDEALAWSDFSQHNKS